MTYLDRAEALLGTYDDETGDLAAMTWLDADPTVAWDDDDSLHGQLAHLLLEAGWDRCYHREGARFHYNVKIDSNERYKGYNDYIDGIEEARGSVFARSEVEIIAEELERYDLEAWWEDIPYTLEDLGETVIIRDRNGPRLYSCGRSGGYLNIPAWETMYTVPAMLRVAPFLEAERNAWRSRDTGEDLAARALEIYDDLRMTSLADNRPDRIEA